MYSGIQNNRASKPYYFFVLNYTVLFHPTPSFSVSSNISLNSRQNSVIFDHCVLGISQRNLKKYAKGCVNNLRNV